MDISHDTVVGGFAVFGDKHFKLAVVTTQHHQGTFTHGVAIYEKMPFESWTIHWTSPSVSAPILRAVADYIEKLHAEGKV